MIARPTSKWWTFLLRGLIAALVGLAALRFPGITLISLSLLFASLAFLDGIALIATAVSAPSDGGNRLLLSAGGVLGVLLGSIAFFVPGLSLLAFSYLIAGWAIGTGVAEATTAWRLRSTMKGEWLWIFAGVLSVFFGIFVAFQPAAGVVFLLYAIAVYAFSSAISLIALALRLRALESPASVTLESRS